MNSWSTKFPRPISAEAKAAVRTHLGELKTAALHQLNTSLPQAHGSRHCHTAVARDNGTTWSTTCRKRIAAEARAALRTHLGELKPAALPRLNPALPCFPQHPARERASLGEIAQQGLSTF